MVQAGGLEPPTSGSTDQRSNQLSYACTCDLLEARSKRPEPRCRPRFWQAAHSTRRKTKARTFPSGLSHPLFRCDKLEGLGSLVEVADAFLDRLRRFGRNFLRMLREFLRLRDQRIKLLAQIGARKLDHLG